MNSIIKEVTKKSKLFVFIICLMTLISSFNTVALASPSPKGHAKEIKLLIDEGFTKNDEQTLNNLLNIGFSVDQIKNLPSSEFEKFRDLDYKLVSKTKKYYRIMIDNKTQKRNIQVFTEGNYFKQYLKDIQTAKISNPVNNELSNYTISSFSTTPGINNSTYWMKLETDIYYTSSTNQYSLYNFFTWKTTPNYRLEDVLGIGISSNFSIIPYSSYCSYSASHYHYDTYNGSYTTTNYINKSTPDSTGQGGIGFKFDLFNDASGSGSEGYRFEDKYTSHQGYMYFRCNLNLNYGSPTYANAFGSYNHQEKTFAISPVIKYPGGGEISLTYQSDFDQVFTTAQCTVY